MRTVHANEATKVPSGRQATQIKQLVDIAHRTNQTVKIMNFPPIDHDAAISWVFQINIRSCNVSEMSNVPWIYQHDTSSEYDPTQSVFCNAYPWLFPGGVGDLYDIKRG